MWNDDGEDYKTHTELGTAKDDMGLGPLLRHPLRWPDTDLWLYFPGGPLSPSDYKSPTHHPFTHSATCSANI